MPKANLTSRGVDIFYELHCSKCGTLGCVEAATLARPRLTQAADPFCRKPLAKHSNRSFPSANACSTIPHTPHFPCYAHLMCAQP